MGWKLFLDDDADTVRRPADTVENRQWRANRMLAAAIPETSHLGDWVIARSCEEAFAEIDKRGLPSFVSFDHDLCDVREGFDGKTVAEFIVKRDMVDGSLPADFAYEVHSWNGRGAIRISSYLDSYLRGRNAGTNVNGPDPADMESYYAKIFAVDP